MSALEGSGCGFVEQSAVHGLLLENGHVMAAQLGHAGRLQAGAARADDGNLSGRGGRPDVQLAFAADDGVDRAGDGLLMKNVRSRQPSLQRMQGRMSLGMVGAGLVGPFGIRPERTAEADKIALARSENLFGIWARRHAF